MAGRGRGLTADRIKKEFGEGRVIEAREALRRGMVDRLFSSTGAAYDYAATWTEDRQRQADLDYVRMGIRIAELQDPTGYAEWQRAQADEDYMRAAIKIAELR